VGPGLPIAIIGSGFTGIVAAIGPKQAGTRSFTILARAGRDELVR